MRNNVIVVKIECFNLSKLFHHTIRNQTDEYYAILKDGLTLPYNSKKYTEMPTSTDYP